jgi:hypothetical protein
MLELLTLLLGVIPAALCSRRDLVLENLLLRHQLAVAARPKRRPRLRTWDKLLWLLGRRLCADWRRHQVCGPGTSAPPPVRPHRAPGPSAADRSGRSTHAPSTAATKKQTRVAASNARVRSQAARSSA